MKTVRQSLLDYDLAQLRAIAECRAVPFTTSNHGEGVDLLTAALLSPAATAIALADLAEPEKDALQALVDHGGQMEGPRFARQYGLIRSMGPARLERERPWQEPANPAEGLWYRGFIFKAFLLTNEGGQEVVYIPTDLLSLLALSNFTASARSGQRPAAPGPSRPAEPAAEVPPQELLPVSQTAAPALIVSGEGRLRENIFSLLVYLQTTPVRWQPKGQPAALDKEALANCLLPPLLPTFSREAELDFLLHLGQRTGLLVVKHERLRPNREPTRSWLQASPTEQAQFLQNGWRADPTWNDLWHVPGLWPQPTGWENSPLLARSKILGYLARLEASPESWFSPADFVATIKRIDPDFQRPGGDYDSWYIKDSQGNYLMGFENWDKVEGALIHHVLTHLLPLLGLVELGLSTPTGPPTAFRLSPAGVAFLTGQPTGSPGPARPRFLRVTTNFQAYVPVEASLYDRFQLARLAGLERREAGQVVYHITQASVGRALRNGVTADQMVAFLARATNNQVPLKVVESLRTWGTRRDTVQLERVTLLRLKHADLLVELRQQPALNALLGEVIGPTTVVIPQDKVAEVRRLLVELGYLDVL